MKEAPHTTVPAPVAPAVIDTLLLTLSETVTVPPEKRCGRGALDRKGRTAKVGEDAGAVIRRNSFPTRRKGHGPSRWAIGQRDRSRVGGEGQRRGSGASARTSAGRIDRDRNAGDAIRNRHGRSGNRRGRTGAANGHRVAADGRGDARTAGRRGVGAGATRDGDRRRGSAVRQRDRRRAGRQFRRRAGTQAPAGQGQRYGLGGDAIRNADRHGARSGGEGFRRRMETVFPEIVAKTLPLPELGCR